MSWGEAIEKLVKRRLENYAAPAPQDWELLEQKLLRARRWYHGWMVGGLSSLLILLSSSAGFSPAAPEPMAPLRSRAPVAVQAPALRPWQALPTQGLPGGALLAPAEVWTAPAQPATFRPLEVPAPALWQSLAQKPSAYLTKPGQPKWNPLSAELEKALHEADLAYVSPLQYMRPWSFEICIYPNFTFRKFTIRPGMENRMHQEFIDAIRHSEKTGFSLNLGLEVSRRIGRITYLHTGLNYITNSFRTDFDFTHFRDAQLRGDEREITGYTLKDRPVRVAFSNANQYHYLQVPLSISYQPWLNDQVRLNLETGFSYLHFMGAEGITLDYRTLEEIALESRSYQAHMASVNVRLGFQYYVNEQINIGLEPSLQYFTNTIYSDQYPFDMVPYSVGLAVNLKVKLRP